VRVRAISLGAALPTVTRTRHLSGTMGAMANLLLVLPAAVVALAGTWLLTSRALSERLPYLVAWSLSLLGLSVALGAMAVGFLTEFGSVLFRAVELGGALIAPLWLALGVIELIAYYVQVRFAAWLFVVSYSIVAAVIVLLDPLNGDFDATLPKPDKHYGTLPLSMISFAHVLVVVALVVCAVVTAFRARGADGDAQEALLPVALVALAGVLIVGGTRGLFPAVLAVIALGVAAGLIWFGAVRTAAGYEADEAADVGAMDAMDEMGGMAEMAAEPYGGRQPEPRRHPMPPDRPLAAFVSAPEPHEQVPYGAPVGSAYPAAPEPPPDLYGQITVYTLLDGREEAFDRLADEAVRAARELEQDTLVYLCHEVVNAPTQRIFYQLFRDQATLQAHQRLPQVQRFLSESRTHVLVTNVIELRQLGGAKVTGLPSLMSQEHRR
jgi:quinol monooxygenase YgiN